MISGARKKLTKSISESYTLPRKKMFAISNKDQRPSTIYEQLLKYLAIVIVIIIWHISHISYKNQKNENDPFVKRKIEQLLYTL